MIQLSLLNFVLNIIASYLLRGGSRASNGGGGGAEYKKSCAKFLATPLFCACEATPTYCRETRQQPENMEKSVELEFLSLLTGLSVRFL